NISVGVEDSICRAELSDRHDLPGAGIQRPGSSQRLAWHGEHRDAQKATKLPPYSADLRRHEPPHTCTETHNATKCHKATAPIRLPPAACAFRAIEIALLRRFMRSPEALAGPDATATLAVTWSAAIDSELAISNVATVLHSRSPSSRASSADSSGPTSMIIP